jgi:chromosome segregation protein
VFLKSLTLKGFKSFADPTTLELEPGVTVVVGPNGSGKSNVVDAIAWVLGAQAPSAVRSQKMDDVIFAGTSARPALGRAEVSLTIDNSAGLLGIEFSEVSVSRILFRTGESEYAINGVPCRLLDVQELLSDAGVGRQQHVIVGQGQIDGVLNARPEDRRAIIEEAAGVLKYRKRKEKAERRLDATEASLIRVQDLLREVRRQLRPLERQAEAARRHGDLMAELTALRIYVAGREIEGLGARLQTLAVAKSDADRAEGELKRELARLDAEITAAGAQLTARGADDVSDRLVRVEQLRERARGLVAVIGERRRAIERDRGPLLDTGVIAVIEHDAARFRDELTDVDAGLAELGPEREQLDADEQSLRAERERRLRTRDGEVAADRASAASAAAEVRGELRSRRAALERGEAELARVDAQREELDRRLHDFASKTDLLRHDCNAAELAEGPLVEQIERAEARHQAAEQACAAALESRQRAAEQLSTWRARADALGLALEAAHARAGAERVTALDGVLGTLLDLVRIDPGWEPAAEAALGEALSAVVVADTAAAAQALDVLRQGDAGGAVLALGLDAHACDPGSPPRGGDWVRPHVRCDRSDVGDVLDILLARAVRVDDIGEAIAIAALDHEAIAVTVGGDRFVAGGWRVGAGAGAVTAAALDEATAATAHAADEVARGDESLATTQRALADSRRHLDELARRLDANDAVLTAASDAMARIQGERREVEVEAEAVGRRHTELAAQLASERERVDELDGLVPELEAGEAAEADAARAHDAVRAELDARAALLLSRRHDLDVRAAALHERHQFLSRRLEEAEQRLAGDAEARATAAERRLHVERTTTALGRLAALVERHRAVVDAHHAELVDRRRRQGDEVRALTARLDGLRSARSDAERQLDATRERARRAELDEAEATLRLESAIDTLRRDLDVEPAVAIAAPAPEVADGSSPPARIRELERELRLLGPINPLALEEFTELQQRHTFLEEQLDDVRTTRRELTRVIKAVDHEIMTVFAGAFADVSENFAALFTTLFPGGVGRLVLTDPDDLLASGIEVEAKPGGKNVKKLSLLSGGERSLTALAFLFAVFRSRPSPFYVMDEVEAALDDLNLHRFLGLLDEFRREAQLLVVSHQKRTMEAGDSLLGVTMQPGGSSKVIVERVSTPV